MTGDDSDLKIYAEQDDQRHGGSPRPLGSGVPPLHRADDDQTFKKGAFLQQSIPEDSHEDDEDSDDDESDSE